MPDNEDFERARKEMAAGPPKGIFGGANLKNPEPVDAAASPIQAAEPRAAAEMDVLKAHVQDEKLLTAAARIIQPTGDNHAMPNNPTGTRHLGFPVRRP